MNGERVTGLAGPELASADTGRGKRRRPLQRGAVTLVFDDGYQAVFEQVLPLLRRHGIPAVFAVPVDTAPLERAEGAPVAPLEEWERMCVADRHELAAHGVTHAALPSLSNADLTHELTVAREVTGASTLVYPGGAHDDRVVNAARPLFHAARTVRPGFEQLPPVDPLRLRSFASTRENFAVWRWNLRALWAWLTNRWLIETHHNVSWGHGPPHFAEASRGEWSTGHGKRHTVPLEALERHLRFLKWLPIRIATIREVLHT